MITFQKERWGSCVGEMRLLWPSHWAELALDRDTIELGCDEAKYEQGDAMGCLHIVTARDDGKLVGYYYGMLMHHLHYKDAGLMCYSDVYFLKSEYRRGGIGTRFLLAVMRTLKDAGVVKFYISTKTHQDHGEVFERLGMKCSDRVFTKLL
jgi:GNAT superfamily N-acetyltransferase